MTAPRPRRRGVAAVLALWLSLVSSGLPALAGSGGRVSGLLLDANGKPARGHALVLLDAQGAEVARGAAAPSGRYAVENVPDGTYVAVVEAPDGTRAAVAAAPLEMRGGRERLNLRLVEQGDEPTAVPTTGQWWGALPTAGKVWVVAGVVALTGIALAGLDDDAGEIPASPSNPSP
jgi:hypothetical protein